MTFYITPDHAPSADGLYLFEKTVELKKSGRAVINIFAASRYILYINERYVCEGPCRSYEKVRYYDSVETELKSGVNHICVKVLHTTNYLSSVYNTALPELAFEASVNGESISSDASWRIRFMRGYAFTTYHMKTVGPYELVTQAAGYLALNCVEAEACVFQEKGFYNKVGVSGRYVLKKRPIPMIYPQESMLLTPTKVGENFAEYDAGEYMTAKLSFDIAQNSNVKIIYAECYEFEDGKHRRDDATGFLKGYYDTVETGETSFVFEPFWYRAFRFIRIEGDAESVRKVSAARVNYPFDITGTFACSDESFNQMQKVSVNTILCCAHEIIADCPYYEQQQYEMDASIQMEIISRMTGDRRLHRKCIEEFAQAQTANGLLSSIYPSRVIQIIPGFSIFWIKMLRDYLENTGDSAFVTGYIGTMDNLLQYFDQVVRENGFISSSVYWDFVDWVPEWNFGAVPLEKDEVHTIYSLYYAYGLKSAEYICRKTGRNGLADEYKSRHEQMAYIVNSRCFDQEKGLYTDGSVTKTYSMHTIVWSVLSEVAPVEIRQALLAHIDDEAISKCSFSMNYFTFRALEQYGMYDKVLSFFGGWKKMLDCGCTTWCENPDSPRSECHGWSGAPLYEFSSNILGVKTGSEEEIVIKPVMWHLTYAKGTVPTRFGLVGVNWRIDKNTFVIEIESPADVTKRLILPDGKEYVFQSTNERFVIPI